LRTRQYAKRQMTWFRREPELHPVSGFGDRPEVIADVLHRIHEIRTSVPAEER
jgi:tRNA A37 N6-isopentenylltransferase MiaA